MLFVPGLLLVLTAGQASAADVRVAVIAAATDEPMATRLQSELRGAGLQPVAVVREPDEAETDPPSLDALRAATGTAAALEVDPARAMVLLCVSADEGAPILRDVAWDAADPAADAMVGVLAVELLRAGLLEVNADRISEARAARLSLAELLELVGAPAKRGPGLVAGAWTAAGTVRAAPQVGVALGGRLPVRGRAYLSADVALPLRGTRFDSDQGTASLTTASIALGAGGWLRDPTESWVPDLGGGVATVVQQVRGESASPAAEGTRSTGLRGSLFARGGVAGPRVGPIGPRGDLRVDWSAPVQLVGTELPIGAWGPVQVAATVGIDVQW